MQKHEIEVESKKGKKFTVSVKHYLENQSAYKEVKDKESLAKISAVSDPEPIDPPTADDKKAPAAPAVK